METIFIPPECIAIYQLMDSNNVAAGKSPTPLMQMPHSVVRGRRTELI